MEDNQYIDVVFNYTDGWMYSVYPNDGTVLKSATTYPIGVTHRMGMAGEVRGTRIIQWGAFPEELREIITVLALNTRV